MQASLSSKASGKHLDTTADRGSFPGTLVTGTVPYNGAAATPAVSCSSTGGWHSSRTPPSPREHGSDGRATAALKLRLNVPPQSGVAERAGLAHDAGNLLGALQLYCDLLALPGVLRDEHRHYADELRQLSGRSGALIDRLLNPEGTCRSGGFNSSDRRRISAGGPKENRAENEIAREAGKVVVPEVIERCRGLLNMIARRAVQIAFDAGSRAPVPISCESLERILVNLTKNAAEASRADGAITLRVKCCQSGPCSKGEASATDTKTRIVLSVEDQGCGMSMAAVKILMAGNAPANSGRGLGLRVVRELVAGTGGEFRLKSELGLGTTVEVAWTADGQTLSQRTEDHVATGWDENNGRQMPMAERLEMDNRKQGGLQC